jgi:hypothetical protein
MTIFPEEFSSVSEEALEQASQNYAKRHPQNFLALKQDNVARVAIWSKTACREWGGKVGKHITTSGLFQAPASCGYKRARGRSGARLMECRSIFQSVPSSFSPHEVHGKCPVSIL